MSSGDLSGLARVGALSEERSQTAYFVRGSFVRVFA